jgi:hypothetical protein
LRQGACRPALTHGKPEPLCTNPTHPRTGGDFPDGNTRLAYVQANATRGGTVLTVDSISRVSVGQVRPQGGGGRARRGSLKIGVCMHPTAPQAHTRTHARTHTHTHIHTCTHKHKHTHSRAPTRARTPHTQLVRVVLDNVKGDLLGALNQRIMAPADSYNNRAKVVRFTSRVAAVYSNPPRRAGRARARARACASGARRGRGVCSKPARPARRLFHPPAPPCWPPAG